MGTFKTSEAAAILNVSPTTLRAWERKFGYPRARRTAGNRRLYSQTEVLALSEALGRGLTIASAVGVAQSSNGADAHALITALGSLSRAGADGVVERSLAVRSLERTVSEVLLPALDRIHERVGPGSSIWAYATDWAAAWLVRVRQLATRTRTDGLVIVGDTTEPLDRLRPYGLALVVCCIRAGLEIVTISTRAPHHLREVVVRLAPDAVIVVGSIDDVVARWGYTVARAAPDALLFRYDLATAAGPNRRMEVLARSPVEAASQIYEATADVRGSR